jgi:hypothetical protein
VFLRYGSEVWQSATLEDVAIVLFEAWPEPFGAAVAEAFDPFLCVEAGAVIVAGAADDGTVFSWVLAFVARLF